jgi:hypothetical protein
MLVFYLLKPDILNDKEALDYYYKYLESQNYKIYDEYIINNWIELSKALYEPDSITDIEMLKKLRKQMITTIKGYQLFYEDKAKITVFDADENKLQELFNFKKDLRKRFVYNTDKYYLVFEEDIPLEKKLCDIDIESIKCKSIIVPGGENCNEPNMIYFNKIHFPDPTIEAVNRDLRIIEENGVVDNNKVKRKIIYGN